MKINNKIIAFTIALTISLGSCKKFLDVEVPKSNIEKSLVFESDVTATGAVLGMYYQIYAGSGGAFGSGTHIGISSMAGLSSDELTHSSLSEVSLIEFETNEINPLNAYNTEIWNGCYKVIYQANTVIEGIMSSTSLTPSIKNQLLGEGYFIRAFCHFYLANLFGDVPLILSTNYEENAVAKRTSTALVLEKVISDLLKSHQLLDEAYIHVGAERIRPNRSTAASMLARVYLYTKRWSEAESYATMVIDNTLLYNLETDLTKVFLKNSSEAIWQIQPAITLNTQNGAADEAIYFSPDYAAYYNACTDDLVEAFEDGDYRYAQWLQPTSDNLHSTPCKYRDFDVNSPLTEYSMVIRLAELYLIRAEARVMQNKLFGEDGGEFDLNKIRGRAGLTATTATTQVELMNAIMLERRVELFSEWGHRWFDLKRWKKADEVLSLFKGSDWQFTDELFPLPQVEMTKNPSLNPQNKGYN